MGTFVTTVVLGLLISAMGIANMMGNISSLHSYHRHRVSEEDRKPFGKQVGLGTLLSGISCVFYGVFHLIYELTDKVVFVWIGSVGLIVLLAVGLFIVLRAIIKYNRGLF